MSGLGIGVSGFIKPCGNDVPGKVPTAVHPHLRVAMAYACMSRVGSTL